MLKADEFEIEESETDETDGAAEVLTLVVDVSGSMFEGGKRLIARGVVREIEQYLRLGYGRAKLRLVAAGDEMRDVEWNQDEDVPEAVLDSKGTFNAAKLREHLKGGSGRILYIGDASWNAASSKAMTVWTAELPPDSFRAIVVGCETPLTSRGYKTFAVEDVFAALDGFVGGGDA